MDIRDPETQKISLLVTFLLGVLYVFFFTTYMPFTFQARSHQLAESRAEYESLQSDVEKARAAVDRLPELEAEVAEVNERWQVVSELLPDGKEVAGFLTRMTIAGQESGVDFALVEPQAPQDREFYTAYPTVIQVDGGYHEIGRFLAEVGNLSRIVQIKNLRLTSGGDGDERIVTANFTAEAYARKAGAVSQ